MKKYLLLLVLLPALALAQSGVWDNPAGIYTNIPVLNNQSQIGTAKNPLNKLYTKDLSISGSQTTTGNQSITGNLSVAGTTTTIGNEKAASFLLTDGSDKNYSLNVTAAGTAYTMTNTSAALDFGTTDPSITINKAGTYLITSKANLEYVGATFAANRTVTLKLRRTNNTAADLTGSSTAIGTNIVTTVSGVLSNSNLPSVIYTTTNTNDVVTIFGDVSTAPSAGSLQATEANIVAVRLY